jgi:L-iditol 2-dehydrogenase
VPCLECHACRHHAYAQCPTYKRTGITAGFEPAGGGYAEYVRVMPFVLPGVVRIPDRNSFLEGALLEPVNTVLKGIRRLALLRGDTVLVAGQGPIGLMFTRLLALRGMRVIATDLLPERLKLAREFGAAEVVQVRIPKAEGRKKSEARNPKPQATDHRLLTTDHGPRTTQHATRITPHASPFDAAVIAVPSAAVVREAQALVRGGGQVLLFSHTRRGDEMPVDLATVCMDEKDLIGSYSSDFRLQEEAARLVFSRKLDAHRLITHQFPLAETAAAVALAAQPSPESLKVVVVQ